MLQENQFVYMTFEAEGSNIGTVVFELFHSIMPRACDNFRYVPWQRMTNTFVHACSI